MSSSDGHYEYVIKVRDGSGATHIYSHPRPLGVEQLIGLPYFGEVKVTEIAEEAEGRAGIVFAERVERF